MRGRAEAGRTELVRTQAGIAQLVALAGEDGLETGPLLAAAGLEACELTLPDVEVTRAQELEVVHAVLAQGAAPDFAFRAGMRYRISAFGMLGYALMNCATMRDAMHLCTRFMGLSHVWCEVDIEERGDTVRFTFVPDDLPVALHAFAVERDMAALAMVSRDLAGHRLPLKRWQMAHARMAAPELYASLIRCSPEFDSSTNCWEMDRCRLDTRLPLADPATCEQCIRICEDLLVRRRLLEGRIGSLRGYLMLHADGMPSMEDAAAHFGMAARTLRRQLRREGTGFREVVHGVRRDLAETLLVEGRLSLYEIADRLGYEDVTSFITAFRRWTGTTPAAWRRERRGS